jgi:hypothetical protein
MKKDRRLPGRSLRWEARANKNGAVDAEAELLA